MGVISRIFRPRPTFRVVTNRTRLGRWRWRVVDQTGKVVALAVIKDSHESREDAWLAGATFVQNIGAPESVMEPVPDDDDTAICADADTASPASNSEPPTAKVRSG